MKPTTSTTNNYFRVPGREAFRIPPSYPEGETEIREKAERIAARKPLAIDWGAIFFFDDRDPASVLLAWDRARRSSSKVAAYRTGTLPPGPWSAAVEIGWNPATPGN